MPALDAGIHAFGNTVFYNVAKAWMAVSSTAMTRREWYARTSSVIASEARQSRNGSIQELARTGKNWIASS
jgi:hypothetical protein